MRPASAFFVPTEVTLPCAMFTAPAFTSFPRLPAPLHFALSLTDCLRGRFFFPHQDLTFIFKSKKLPLTPPEFGFIYVSVLTTSLCISKESIRNTYLESKVEQ